MKKTKYLKWASLLFIGIAVSACLADSQNAGTADIEPLNLYAELDEQRSLGDWEITVHSIRIADEISPSPDSQLIFVPKEGSLFVIAGMTVQYTGDYPQRFIPERVMLNSTLHPSIIFGDISGRTIGKTGRFNVVSLGRQHLMDLSNYGFSKDDKPLRGIVVFEVSQTAIDDTDTSLILSFVLYKDAVVYDIRKL